MTAQSSPSPIPSPIYPPAIHGMPQMPVALGKYDDDLDVGQLLQVLRRRWVVIGGVALAVSGAIWSWTLTRVPVFQGEFRVLVASVEDIDPSQELLRETAGPSTVVDYDTQIEVLKSPALLAPIARSLQTQYPGIAYSNLVGNLTISRLRDTKVLSVSYRHPDPQTIQNVLEEISNQYLEYSFEQRQANLQQGIQFVDDQLPELRERVQSLQIQMERFRQQYSILDPETRGNEISGLLATVEAQRQQLQAELAQAQSLFQTLQEQLDTTPEDAIADAALSESARYQALLTQIQQLEAEIAVESARYQPGAPQLLALEERRDNLLPLLETESARILGDRFIASEDQSAAYLTPTALNLNRELIESANNIQMLQARNRTLARIESDIKEEFDLVPALARQYTDLQRDLAIATESLNRFLTTRETLQIDAAQNSIPWQLIAPPNLPTTPISPNIPRNLTLGIVAGLLVGSAAALMAEKLDQVYHSPDDLKQAISLPMLGVVPYFPNIEQQTENLQKLARFNSSGFSGNPFESANGNSGTPNGHSGAILSENGEVTSAQSSIFLEAFRSVYTNIKFLETEQSIRSLVISSAVPNEGKSTTALYLARAAAMMGQRVLLVDADLRAPKHHGNLNLPNIRGLSNVLAEGLHVSQAVQPLALDAHLSVLTAGPQPPDPVKLLSSQRMQAVAADLTEHYDLVVYDMPPLLGFADSSVLAAHTDGMLLVVGLGHTERSALNRALDELKLSPVSLLGIVANGIKPYTTPGRNYSYYYQYYGDRSARPRQPAAVLSNRRKKPKPRPADPEPNGRPVAVAAPPQPEFQDTTIPVPPDSTSDPVPRPSDYPPSPPPAPSNGSNSEFDNIDPSRYAPAQRDEEFDGDAGPAIATIQSSFPALPTLSSKQWSIVGAIALTLSSALGWTLYHRSLKPTPEPSAEFAQAERLAESAVTKQDRASTAQDWAEIRDLWYEAAALMDDVPATDERYAQASDYSNQYREKGDSARRQVLLLIAPPLVD
ncbi:MAG: GumC family protein [Leptolyngbyaceae cyanobacterium]